jgi:hypothetical protein
MEDEHQDVLGELSAEFRMYLRGKECRAFASPIDVSIFAKKDTPYWNRATPLLADIPKKGELLGRGVFLCL